VQSINSNCGGLKEEEEVHRLAKDMENEKMNLEPVNAVME
jgi:hypothetical protein